MWSQKNSTQFIADLSTSLWTSPKKIGRHELVQVSFNKFGEFLEKSKINLKKNFFQNSFPSM